MAKKFNMRAKGKFDFGNKGNFDFHKGEGSIGDAVTPEDRKPQKKSISKTKSPFSFLNFNFGGSQVSKGGDRRKTKVTGDKDIF